MSQKCNECQGYLFKWELGPTCSICNRAYRDRVDMINEKLYAIWPNNKITYTRLCFKYGQDYTDEVVLPALYKRYNV